MSSDVLPKAPIFHLSTPADFAAAQAGGAYLISTRGRTLEQEGFIHASSAAQWPTVRRLFYGDLSEPLLLLEIDPDRLSAPLVWEVGNPQTGEEFPHIYGPLNLDAIVATRELPAPHDR